MLKEIRLYGWLGEKYGKVHYYAVDSVREAVKALQTNFPTFSKDIIEYKPGYKVWSGTTRLGKNDLVLPVSNREIIRIVPLRDSLFIIKEDGVYRIIGEDPTSLRISLFDNKSARHSCFIVLGLNPFILTGLSSLNLSPFQHFLSIIFPSLFLIIKY